MYLNQSQLHVGEGCILVTDESRQARLTVHIKLIPITSCRVKHASVGKKLDGLN